MCGHRELLLIPGVAPLLVSPLVARLPYGMSILGLILLLRAQGFDYAEAGLVTAASGISMGVAALCSAAWSTASGRRGCCLSLRR